MMSLKFHIANVDTRKIIFFRKPSEIGFFSVDGNREYHDDGHQMKWIYKPPSGWDQSLSPGFEWDLNVGYSQAIKKDFYKREKMINILKWISNHQEKIQHVFLSPSSNARKIDFVCSRGLLAKISATPYDASSDWSFCASKFKSTLYMCSFETSRQIYERRNATDRQKLMTSWGAKFEQYMACDTPNSKPNTSIPVNEKEEYHIVLKGQLNGYTLLYNAEVDGKDPDIQQYRLSYDKEFKSTDCYIELKTARNGADRGRYYREKLLSWWLQSFFGGIPKIICGFRDDNGVVEKLKTYRVEDIPESKKLQYSWKKEVCLKFCYHILHFVKDCVEKDDSETVYRFSYELGSPYVKCEEIINPAEDYKLLPEWFTAEANI